MVQEGIIFQAFAIGGIDVINKTGLIINEENMIFIYPVIFIIGLTDGFLLIADIFVFTS